VFEELQNLISPSLPLRVSSVEFHDPTAVLAGSEWSLAITCPWRVTRGGALVTSPSDPHAAARLGDLVGGAIASLRDRSGDDTPADPVFVFSDGARLELFADTDVDPWVMHLPGAVFVGSASRPTR
jgi:hypothetical protein